MRDLERQSKARDAESSAGVLARYRSRLWTLALTQSSHACSTLLCESSCILVSLVRIFLDVLAHQHSRHISSMTLRAMAKTALDIDGARMMRTLHQTCNWGAAHRYGPYVPMSPQRPTRRPAELTRGGSGETETGMRRLALSDDDKRVRDWLAGQVAQLGCTLTVDRMGNMFAVRPGRKPGPPTMMGSHLDTQPTGGRYDGILGVMAALEGLRTLHEKSVETEYPIGLVNWTKLSLLLLLSPYV